MNIKKIALYGFAILGALFILAIIAAMVQTLGDRTETTVSTPSTIPKSVQPAQTPEPLRASILVKASTQATRQIGKYYSAGEGKTFLIYNLEIENHGYTKFNTNPFYWKTRVNNIEYQPATVTFSQDVNKLESVDVLDGGKVKGQLVFEVPDEANIRSTLVYYGIGNYNIVYSAMN